MPKGIAKPECEFIAGLKLDYGWSNMERTTTIKMLNNGANVKDVAEEFNRELMEVMILVDDLLRKKLVKPSKSIMKGVF